LASNDQTAVYRDFAHAPSKVKATIEAVKSQFPGRKLIGVLELHTYSSLNEAFMKEYNGALEPADQAVVFYSKHALEIKRLPDLPEAAVQQGFNKSGLLIFTDAVLLKEWLLSLDYHNSNLLLMSSGNYDGIQVVSLAEEIIQKTDTNN